MAGIIKGSFNLAEIPKDKIIEGKAPKTYLGNVKVVWTNGTFPEPVKLDQPAAMPQPQAAPQVEDDLPF